MAVLLHVTMSITTLIVQENHALKSYYYIISMYSINDKMNAYSVAAIVLISKNDIMSMRKKKHLNSNRTMINPWKNKSVSHKTVWHTQSVSIKTLNFTSTLIQLKMNKRNKSFSNPFVDVICWTYKVKDVIFTQWYACRLYNVNEMDIMNQIEKFIKSFYIELYSSFSTRSL